jgi:hypothetical protein
MLSASLSALFFALLPEGLFAMGLSRETVWRAGSGLLVAYLFVFGRTTALGLRELSESERAYFDRRLAIVATVLFVWAMLLEALNAIGIWWPPSYWAYYFGILVLLSMAAFQFVRIVFVRPGDMP